MNTIPTFFISSEDVEQGARVEASERGYRPYKGNLSRGVLDASCTYGCTNRLYVPSELDFPVTPPEKRDIELAITICALWSPTHRYESYCVKTDLKAV